MLYKQFSQHLQQGDPAPAYLFLGSSDLLLDEAWKALVEKLVPPKARKFNGERLQAGECEAEEALNRLRTLPMFGTRRLLMVQNVEAWKKEQRDSLLNYLAHPNPNACLVLTAASRKGLEKVEAAVNSRGLVVTFPVLGSKEIPRWLQERARQRGKQMSSQAAYYLFEQVGEDLSCLEQELEKLCLYVGDRSRIELEDLEEAVSAQKTFTVFELVRYVGQKNAGMALRSLRALTLSGQPPLVILSLLARQIRILWQVKEGVENNVPLPEIAREAGLPLFVVQGHAGQAAAFTHEELYGAHALIRRADLSMKSTGTNPAWILESVVVSLCLNKTSP